MDWIRLDESLLPSLLDAAELSRLTTESLRAGESPVDCVLEQTAAQVRGRLTSGGRVRLSPDPLEVPSELLPTAGAMVRYRLLVRFSLKVSEERKAEYNEALAVLRELSEGKYVPADSPADTSAQPFYAGRPKRWGPSSRGTIH